MSVTIAIEGQKMIAVCNHCDVVLDFTIAVSEDEKKQIFETVNCKCRKEPKAPEHKMCRNCGDEFSIPAFCNKCEGE